MLLAESFGNVWFIVCIEVVEHRDESILVFGALLVARQFKIALFRLFCYVADAQDVFYGLLVSVSIGEFKHRLFSHAVGQYIGFGIKEDGASDFVCPEVIVGDTP